MCTCGYMLKVAVCHIMWPCVPRPCPSLSRVSGMHGNSMLSQRYRNVMLVNTALLDQVPVHMYSRDNCSCEVMSTPTKFEYTIIHSYYCAHEYSSVKSNLMSQLTYTTHYVTKVYVLTCFLLLLMQNYKFPKCTITSGFHRSGCVHGSSKWNPSMHNNYVETNPCIGIMHVMYVSHK